jgi:hypothetical protein
VEHVFNLVKEKDGEYVFESICKNYLALLLEKKFPGAVTPIETQDIQFVWFLLDVTIKSMYLKVLDSGEIYTGNATTTGFTDLFCQTYSIGRIGFRHPL